MEDYLELCDFVMREASSSCNGLLLRGSSLYHERAIKLLVEYNYNYELAKFHVMNPSLMILPEKRIYFERMLAEDREVF